MSLLMIVDDDTDVLDLNKSYFEKEGYDVITFDRVKDAIKALSTAKPDCILLDIMMPELDGLTALPEIKKSSIAPVIFLTGKDTDEDKVTGLLSGADDYVVKPYSLKELSARITVQLRRGQTVKNNNIIYFPPLTIDLINHKLFYNDEDVPISNREFELLYMLASHPGKIITFEEIGTKIWKIYQESDRRSIMVMASRLRKKLESYSGLENCIETRYGKGYKFIIPH